MCKALQSCAESGYKPEALERLLTCFLELPCDGGSDDACYESASNDVPNETFDAYVAACAAKRGECTEEVKESLSGPTIDVLKDEIVEAATLCFDEACAEAALAPAEGCFEQPTRKAERSSPGRVLARCRIARKLHASHGLFARRSSQQVASHRLVRRDLRARLLERGGRTIIVLPHR